MHYCYHSSLYQNSYSSGDLCSSVETEGGLRAFGAGPNSSPANLTVVLRSTASSFTTSFSFTGTAALTGSAPIPESSLSGSMMNLLRLILNPKSNPAPPSPPPPPPSPRSTLNFALGAMRDPKLGNFGILNNPLWRGNDARSRGEEAKDWTSMTPSVVYSSRWTREGLVRR